MLSAALAANPAAAADAVPAIFAAAVDANLAVKNAALRICMTL